MTQKLYYHHPYMTDFTANVVKHIMQNGKSGLILDRTAFYPTGGGQPHDTGRLSDYQVIDVYVDGDEIVHIIDGDYYGERQLSGSVNWQRRFDHMQQHAGQHILSAVLLKEYGWETIGFHLGTETVTIDVTTAATIPFNEIEAKVNAIIVRNLPIDTQFVARETLDPYVVRKIPNDDRYVRIVEIPDVDLNACSGTHPAHTAEIGIVKLLHTETIRGSRRIHFVAGNRALALFQAQHETLGDLAAMLKTSRIEVHERVSRLRDEYDMLAKEYKRVGQELLYWESRDWQEKYEAIGFYRLYTQRWAHRPFQELKELAKILIEGAKAIVVFASSEPKAQIVLACSDDVPYSMLELAQDLAHTLEGKGGGSRVFAQVGGSNEHLDAGLAIVVQKLQQLHEIARTGHSSGEKEV